MDALKPSIALALTLLAAPYPAHGAPSWQPFVTEAARRFAVPEAWIMRVIRAESAGMTHVGGAPIRSRVGAMGLMQLMPATWANMRDTHRLGTDPDDPRDNILAGTAYLRMMFDRFGYPGLFGAYNAGPARYAAHRDRGRALPLETRLYMAKITGDTAPPPAAIMPDGVVQAVYEPPAPSVFAVKPASNEAASEPLTALPKLALFAVRKGTP